MKACCSDCPWSVAWRAPPRELPRPVQAYLDLHPHPVSVHIRIALTLASYGLWLTGTSAGKAGLSVAPSVMGTITAVLWSLHREAVADREVVGWACLALVLVMSGPVLPLGKLGGALVFPPRGKTGRKP